MKSGEIKKVVQAYVPFFHSPWKRVRNEFMRREGDWVQIISFNASRWADKYEPRSCFEFLKQPGDPVGGFLVQGLQHPNRVQRWVNAAKIADPASNDYAPKVFDEMTKQFKPSIPGPLVVAEIKQLLEASLGYWPHPYALCVMAAEAGNKADAERYFEVFQADVDDKPYPWAESAREELRACLEANGSEKLSLRLEGIATEKLKKLRLVA